MSLARLVLVLAVVLGALTTLSYASAQTDQVAQVEAENVSLGPGCNPIGIAIEGPTAPIAPTQEWIDEHTACATNGAKTLVQCQGALSSDQRYEVCSLIFNTADGQFDVSCDDMVLMSPDAMAGPDLQLTAEAIQYFRDTLADSNLDTAVSRFVPCSDNPLAEKGTAVLAAFLIPRYEGHLVVRSRVGSGIAEQVAFIVMDARAEMP